MVNTVNTLRLGLLKNSLFFFFQERSFECLGFRQFKIKGKDEVDLLSVLGNGVFTDYSCDSQLVLGVRLESQSLTSISKDTGRISYFLLKSA